LFRFSTGRRSTLQPLLHLGLNPGRGFSTPALAVSPDERWILYVQMDRNSSDLMLVENFR